MQLTLFIKCDGWWGGEEEEIFSIINGANSQPPSIPFSTIIGMLMSLSNLLKGNFVIFPFETGEPRKIHLVLFSVDGRDFVIYGSRTSLQTPIN